MGEMISIPTSSRRRPLPEGGIYGPGLQVEADVELYSLEPAEQPPGYDKAGEFSPYWEFTFRIMPADGPQYFVRDKVSFAAGSGSKAIPWLEAAGVPFETSVDPDGNECFNFDKDAAAPRKIGGIEMGSPREWVGDDNVKRQAHGRILQVIGKE